MIDSLDDLDFVHEGLLELMRSKQSDDTGLADLIKASFGGDRSAAGRYAANIRWQGNEKGNDKKYPKELTTKEMVNILYEAQSVQDALGLIAKSLGKDAKPQLRILEDSEVTHYRGASDPTASIGFVLDWSLNDIPFATWGQGLYITPLRGEASIYGKPYRLNLDKSAKLIVDEIPWSEGDKWLKVKSSEPYESSKVVNYSKLKFNPSGSDLINFYWASKGYDGAFIQGDEVVLFNGSKLTVDKRDLSSKEIQKFLTNLVKASFGGDRSAAGRYAAEQRWKGHVKQERQNKRGRKKATSESSDKKFKEKYGNERAFGKGDCFQAAANLLFDKFVDNPDARICHGVPLGRGGIEGIRFDHAWVEVDELQGTLPNGREIWDRTVYDYSNGNEVVMPAALYYHYGNIESEDVRRFTAKEALEKMKETGFYGPWE